MKILALYIAKREYVWYNISCSNLYLKKDDYDHENE